MNQLAAIYPKFILLLFLCFVSPEAAPVYFSHIGTDEGLSHSSVLSIYQDMHGRMWFGTNEGLTLYDGCRLDVFKPDVDLIKKQGLQQVQGNRITSICGDKEGNVFFLAGHSLVKYDIRRESFSQIRLDDVSALTAHDGKIWCAAHDSLFYYDPETNRLRFYLKTALSSITCLGIFDSSRFWIGTREGLYLTGVRHDMECILPGVIVYSFYRSSRKDLWVSTRKKGLYRITAEGEILRLPFDKKGLRGIASNQVRQLAEDRSGNLWIGTFEGLQRYNPEDGSFKLYTCKNQPGTLSHSSVFPLYRDTGGTIWIGTYYGGVNYFNPENDLFTYYPALSQSAGGLNYPFAGEMTEDREGNLWICTEGGGLNCLDRENRTFSYYLASGVSAANGLPHNNLKSISYNEELHSLYIGTHTGGLSELDLQTRAFRNYLPLFRAGKTAPGDIIDRVMCYRGKVVVASRNGTFVMDARSRDFTLLGDGKACRYFDIDSRGVVWMLQDETLVSVDLADLNKQQEYPLSRYGIDFSAGRLLADQDGIVYLATLGAGIYRFNTRTGNVTQYTARKNSLLSNYCYNMIKTKQGELLITCDKGMMLFNPVTLSVKAFSSRTGMPLTSITENCGVYICRNNEIFIGGTNGLVSLKLDDLNKQEIKNKLYFTHLFVNNKPVYPGDTTQVLEQALPFLSGITLDYTQNNLLFHFAESNYSSALRNDLYEYKLEGFDKEWVSVTNASLHYTNLNPGDYVLKIRKALLYTAGIPQETSLHVVIRHPWYDTWWAWFMYMLSGILILCLGWSVKKSRLELAMSLREERNEKERIERLNQAKLRFFTNISHEFRTPLTLIISHLDILTQNNKFSPAVYNRIKKVYQHTYRMRDLITELLEFRKFDQQQVVLHVSEVEVVAWLRPVYLSFSDMAEQRAIRYRFTSDMESSRCWMDPAQMQKVFYNLLSNAFKYTPDGGSIELRAAENDHQVVVQVIDNGIGLAASDKERIFERFYQVENQGETGANPGTGIGLALTKSIIGLHRGDIAVESSPGYGTIFIVTLEKGRSHYEGVPHVVVADNAKEPGVGDNRLPESGFYAMLREDNKDAVKETDALPVLRYVILLVEDNEELMQVLVSLFSPFYTVLSAFNGKEGLEKATAETPDLIVCDVMMPVMDGKEMCRRVKNDIHLCHIPVILLSALNSEEQNVEGLQCGADDYIGKPFSARTLLLRCNNMIRNRQFYKNRLAEQNEFDLSLLATNLLDKELLTDVIAFIEQHIDDSNLDVNIVAKNLGLGRSSFFAKFKALTGLTPANFILEYRLKKAAVLLRSYPEMQIAEISDRLGFNTSTYFSKCFKAKFNLSPMDYRKNSIHAS